jgi:hypothetical protein
MRNFNTVKAALRLLLESYGDSLRVDDGYRAPVAAELLSEGLSKAQLHLLVQNGYCQWQLGQNHYRTKPGPIQGTNRRAIPVGGRLALTPAGAMLARQILYPLVNAGKGKKLNGRYRNGSFPDLTLPAVPRFNADNHEVWWGSHLVKRFNRPAPNLEAILTALEKSNWSEHVATILTPKGDRLSKYQLHEAIKTWNESSLGKFIALHGDGLGQGIRWERLK